MLITFTKIAITTLEFSTASDWIYVGQALNQCQHDVQAGDKNAADVLGDLRSFNLCRWLDHGSCLGDDSTATATQPRIFRDKAHEP